MSSSRWLAVALLVRVDACDHRAPIDTQPARGSDEASYCRAAIGHEICKRPEQVQRSIELRTRAFPESADAWLALARWQVAPLKPQDSGLPYNTALAPEDRLRIVGELLTTLANAKRLRPQDPLVRDLIAVANEQGALARGDALPNPPAREVWNADVTGDDEGTEEEIPREDSR